MASSSSYQPQKAGVFDNTALPPKPLNLKEPLAPGFHLNATPQLFVACLIYTLFLAFPIGLAAFVAYMVLFSVGLALTVLVVGLVILQVGNIVSETFVFIDTRILLKVFEDRVPVQLVSLAPDTAARLTGFNLRSMLRGVLKQAQWTFARFLLGVCSFVVAIFCSIFLALSLGFAYPILAKPICALAAMHLQLNMPFFLELTSAAGRLDPAATPVIDGPGSGAGGAGGAAAVAPPPSYEATINDPEAPPKPEIKEYSTMDQ